MGKWKAIIPMALALGIALAASFLLYNWLKRQTTPQVVMKVETEALPVTVAAVELPWGTKLKPEMLKAVPYLKNSLPMGHFSNPESINGRVLIAAMKQNEPILESKLAPTSVTTGGVSAIVRPGRRALAVKGDKVIGISGFIRPSDRVDVLVTIKDPRTKKEITKTVLEDVQVLATGTVVEEKAKGGKPHPVDVYTLEVTPEEGERLALAATQGRLQFALRNITDKQTVLTQGSTVVEALSSFRPPKKKAKYKPPTANTRGRNMIAVETVEVEVIKGDKMGKIKF